jgi:hypothetical protein
MELVPIVKATKGAEMKVMISQCIECGQIYACNINGLRRECINCIGEDCVKDYHNYTITHGYCPYHLAKHMKKFKPNFGGGKNEQAPQTAKIKGR